MREASEILQLSQELQRRELIVLMAVIEESPGVARVAGVGKGPAFPAEQLGCKLSF
jgi:hypothetical protein